MSIVLITTLNKREILNIPTNLKNLKPENKNEQAIYDLLYEAMSVYSAAAQTHLKLLAKARKLARRQENPNFLAVSYSSTGQLVKYDEGYRKSIYWFNKALRIESINPSIRGFIANNKSFALISSGRLEEGYTLACENLKQMENANLPEPSIIALTIIGIYFDHTNNPVRALEYFNSAVDKARLVNDAVILGNTIKQVGDNYVRRGKYSKAIDSFLEVCKILENEPPNPTLAQAYNNLAVAYYRTGFLEKALDAHLKSYTLKSELNDNQGMAFSYNNIAVIYKSMNQPKRAVKYYADALAIYEKIEMPSGIAMVLNNLGLTYSDQGKYDEAVSCYLKSLQIRKDIGDNGTIIRLYHNLADLYTHTDDLDKAEHYFRKALELVENEKEPSTDLYIGLANLYLKTKQLDLAEKYLLMALNLSEKLQLPLPGRDAHKLLSDLYAAQKKYRKAWDHLHQFTRMLREEHESQLNTRVTEMQSRFELERSEKEKQILHEKNRELKRLNQKLRVAQNRLKDMATHDPLTGLLNRRAVMQRIRREKIRYDRSRRSFSFIILDIDDFKQVNDCFGHSSGDKVLKTVADCISSTIRKQDEAARWGGEEFLVFCPDTNEQGILVIAEKIRTVIAEQRIHAKQNRIQVTVTCGVACINHYATIDDCINAADEALYDGKRTGKNRVNAPGMFNDPHAANPDIPNAVNSEIVDTGMK